MDQALWESCHHNLRMLGWKQLEGIARRNVSFSDPTCVVIFPGEEGWDSVLSGGKCIFSPWMWSEYERLHQIYTFILERRLERRKEREEAGWESGSGVLGLFWIDSLDGVCMERLTLPCLNVSHDRSTGGAECILDRYVQDIKQGGKATVTLYKVMFPLWRKAQRRIDGIFMPTMLETKLLKYILRSINKRGGTGIILD